MDIKRLLKRAGKGLVITAASLLAGVTLGPLAAGAVGGFLQKKMSEVGVSVTTGVIERNIEDYVLSTPGRLVSMVETRQMKTMAGDVAESAGVSQVTADAAVQYAFRDLHHTLSSITQELQADKGLMMAALQLARETDAKVDSLLSKSQETLKALDDVRQILRSMDRHLDRSYRTVVGAFSERDALDVDRLMITSRLQRQDATLASRFDIKYNDDVYVPREPDEAVFEEFMACAGTTDRNIFLVLGDAGMGKTWFLSALSNYTLAENSPTFFIPLRHGVRALTSTFHCSSLTETVTLFDSVLEDDGRNAYFFLDGLDEMPPRERRGILSTLSTSRVGTISFILSCRFTDWSSDSIIVQGAHELEYYVHDSSIATNQARSRGISTPVSVVMSEFTPVELEQALDRYGLPPSVPVPLQPLLRKPFLLRLIAIRYLQTGQFPLPSSHEFLDLFAGEQDQSRTILGRLGILTERDALYETVEQFIDTRSDSLPLTELEDLDPEDASFRTIVSSGLLRLSVTRYGTSVVLDPDFMIPLLVLTVMRHEARPDRKQELLNSLQGWMPDVSMQVQEILTKPREVPSVEVEPIEMDDVSSLMVDLKNQDFSVRYNAVDQLGRLGDNRAVDPLIDALKDQDVKIRAMAVRSLSLLGNIRAVEPLRKLAQSDESQDVSIKARWAADRIVDKSKNSENTN